MKHNQPIIGVLLVVLLAAVSLAGCNREKAGESSVATSDAPVTRAEVKKIVHHEVERVFALRSWHKYASYVQRYKGSGASSLFTLTDLDRGTAVGNADASVRAIVYEDYECPFCKRFESTSAARMKREFNSRALFVYRFYPLPAHGKVARHEAIAGACIAYIAGSQAFWRYTRSVFARTGSNGKGTKTPLDTIARHALQTRQGEPNPVDSHEAYRRCTQGEKGASLIQPASNFKGVRGTPTLFVVDTKQHHSWRVAGALPTWVFKAVITNVLAGKPGDSDWAITHHKVEVPD